MDAQQAETFEFSRAELTILDLKWEKKVLQALTSTVAKLEAS